MEQNRLSLLRSFSLEKLLPLLHYYRYRRLHSAIKLRWNDDDDDDDG